MLLSSSFLELPCCARMDIRGGLKHIKRGGKKKPEKSITIQSLASIPSAWVVSAYSGGERMGEKKFGKRGRDRNGVAQLLSA